MSDAGELAQQVLKVGEGTDPSLFVEALAIATGSAIAVHCPALVRPLVFQKHCEKIDYVIQQIVSRGIGLPQ